MNADAVRQLIEARCPELSSGDLASLVPVDLMEKIVASVDALAERVAALEQEIEGREEAFDA